MRYVLGILILSCLTPALFAQENPLSAHNRRMYNGVSKLLIRTAELMPEEKYSYKPAESVRSFGQIVGHVSDTQYYFCSSVLGEKYASRNIEKTKTSKAELVAALTDAVAYCNKAHDSITDATASRNVTVMRDNAVSRDRCAEHQQSSQHRALRESRYVSPDERHRSADQRSGVHEAVAVRGGHRHPSG